MTSRKRYPRSRVRSMIEVGTHCGLIYEIWTDSSQACLTNTSEGFRAYWDAGDMNYLVSKGVRPGSTDIVITYSADYNPEGVSYLGAHGWMENPIVEYYIVDSWGLERPSTSDPIDTVTMDGGSYDIYRERINLTGIPENGYWRLWSVRQEKRTDGSITVGDHFIEWESHGLTLGTLHDVSMAVEGIQSAGTADVTVSFR